MFLTTLLYDYKYYYVYIVCYYYLAYFKAPYTNVLIKIKVAFEGLKRLRFCCRLLCGYQYYIVYCVYNVYLITKKKRKAF